MTACVFHDTDPSQQDRRLFEIVERAYDQQKKVLVFAPNRERAGAIDRLLWTTKQESFIPHEVVTAGEPDSLIPVAIVTSELNPIGAAILIADGHCSLDFALGFESIHEFVNRSTPRLHQACRERFRAYRDRQVPVEHVKSEYGVRS